jgi:phosphate starvation-inducible PhoH-like protein
MMKKTKKRLTKEELEELETWETQRSEPAAAPKLKAINIKCKTKNQKDVLTSIEEKIISIIIGPPGTGKTYLSCARALKFLREEPTTYKKIVLIKSVNVPKDEEIGYLKGTLEEKMEGFMYPFISNFEKVVGPVEVDRLKSKGQIEILPIKFALGATLDNSVIIVDEAQQISKDNLRTLITRIGNGSKMIFLGDIKQKSVNKREKSALEILIEHFTSIEEIGIVQLDRSDIVRHPIIQKIEEIFDQIEESEKLNGTNINKTK